jgi:hypothetical protein
MQQQEIWNTAETQSKTVSIDNKNEEAGMRTYPLTTDNMTAQLTAALSYQQWYHLQSVQHPYGAMGLFKKAYTHRVFNGSNP